MCSLIQGTLRTPITALQSHAPTALEQILPIIWYSYESNRGCAPEMTNLHHGDTAFKM